jgi:DNA-binding NarL/FixJ family response regulator
MRKIRMMIVDDLAPARWALRLFLEETADGLEIVGEADNGLEAVRLAERLSPDIVLMDLEMPVMDGFESARQIKDRHLAKGVIVVTARGYGGTREQAAKAGVDAFVEKVTAAETLIPAIWNVFGKLSTRAA